MESKLQTQYDKIYTYFKSTSEPFDDLQWEGNILMVYHEDEVIEEYTYSDLLEIIPDFQ